MTCTLLDMKQTLFFDWLLHLYLTLAQQAVTCKYVMTEYNLEMDLYAINMTLESQSLQ